MEDLYEILGLDKSLSCEEIKKESRKKMMDLHPDKGGDPDFFKKFMQAYDVLTDPKQREGYDLNGEVPLSDEQLKEEAQKRLIALFTSTVELNCNLPTFMPDNCDIFDSIKRHVSSQIQAAINLRVVLENKVNKIQKIIDRLDCEVTLYKSTLEELIKREKKNISNLGKDQQVADMMMVLLRTCRMKDIMSRY